MPSSETWIDHLKHCATFSTVEDFWSAFNSVIPCSKLVVNANYRLFKKDRKPMWEDEKNKKGGKWMINIAQNKDNSNKGKVRRERLEGDSREQRGGAALCSLSLSERRIAQPDERVL